MHKIRNVSLAATAVLMSTALAACGGGATSSTAPDTSSVSYDCAKPNADHPTKVSVSALPIVSNGAIYAGIDQGFFAKNGLDVDVQPMADPAAGISSVQGGTTDFAFASTVATMQAIDKGLKVSIVAPFAGIAPHYYDKMKAGENGYTTEITAIVGRAGIGALSALAGKTVAVADVKGQSELTTRYVLKQAGVDPDKVKLTLMPFPDSLNAFKAGKVDAIFTVEPFLNQAEQAGGKVLAWPGVETFHEGPTSAMIASNSFIQRDGETVARFNCAIRSATAYANQHPDEIRNVVAEQQKVDPKTLASAVVPYFYQSVDVAGLQRFEQIMRDNGFLTKDIDVKTIVIPQAVQSH